MKSIETMMMMIFMEYYKKVNLNIYLIKKKNNEQEINVIETLH
jgi:hypothetical protein